MKKYFVYLIGVIVMTFGVALSSFHGLGASPFDTLSFNLHKITEIDLGIVMIIMNAVFLLIYFMYKRNKDIYISVIVVLLFSLLVSFFVKILTPIIVIDDLWFRLILFLLGFIFTSIGIALVEVSSLSKTAYECFNSFIHDKVFKKMSYGASRVIVDVTLSLSAAILGLVFLNSTGDAGLGTIFYMIFTGPVVQFLMKRFKIGK